MNEIIAQRWISIKNDRDGLTKTVNVTEAAKKRAIADALSHNREDKRINEQTREVRHE